MVSVILVVVLVGEALCLLFNASVIFFVVCSIRTSNAQFHGGFYKIFVVQCLVEFVCYFEGSFLKRMNEYGVFQKSWFDSTALGCQWSYAIGYSTVFLYFSHTTISLNRFTSLRFSLQHEKIWSGACLILIQLAILILPLPLNALRVFCDVRPVDIVDGGFMIMNVIRWSSEITSLIAAIVCITTCLISALLEAVTFVLYRRLNNHRRLRHAEDYRLLLYALTALVSQFLLAVNYAVFFYVPKGSRLAVFQQYVYAYVIDVHTLSGPLCLMITSKTTRRHYLRFYLGQRINKTSTVVVLNKH